MTQSGIPLGVNYTVFMFHLFSETEAKSKYSSILDYCHS